MIQSDLSPIPPQGGAGGQDAVSQGVRRGVYLIQLPHQGVIA